MGRSYYDCPCCGDEVWVHSFWGAAWKGSICLDCRNKHGNQNVFCQLKEKLKKETRELERTQRELVAAQKSIKTKGLMLELHRIIDKLDNEQDKFDKFKKQHDIVSGKIKIEEVFVKNFKRIRTEKDTRLITALGMTGAGKSTFSNRLLGDKTKKGDKGPFPVGHAKDSLEAKTTKIKLSEFEINNIKYALADTPGFNDTKQRDTEFTIKLVEYFRGCGGVNAFLIFFPLSEPRFNDSYQKLMKEYEKMLQKDFWKHVIIIGTKADKEDDEDIPDLGVAIQNKIREKMDLDEKEYELPFIPIGRNTYNQGMQELNKLVQHKKYEPDCLTSPIDELYLEHDASEKGMNKHMKTIKKLEKDKSDKEQEISIAEN